MRLPPEAWSSNTSSMPSPQRTNRPSFGEAATTVPGAASPARSTGRAKYSFNRPSGISVYAQGQGFSPRTRQAISPAGRDQSIAPMVFLSIGS